MKLLILLLSFIALTATAAFAQTVSKKVPLDLAIFVKSADTAPDLEPEPEKHNPTVVKKKFSDEGSSTTEVSVDYAIESLTNGRGNWHEGSLNVIHKFSPRKVLYGTYRETSRFRARDREARVGLYQPLNRKWTIVAEASASPTHKVLPKWSAMAQIERAFPKGWIAQAGFRRTELDEAKVNISKLGLEKYWGLNRAAYTFSINNLQETGTTTSQRIQYNRYYSGESSSVGVSFAFGREIEKVGPDAVLQSRIFNVSVSGKHRLRDRWGLNYGYTFHRQGALYDRKGLRIGIHYKF